MGMFCCKQPAILIKIEGFSIQRTYWNNDWKCPHLTIYLYGMKLHTFKSSNRCDNQEKIPEDTTDIYLEYQNGKRIFLGMIGQRFVQYLNQSNQTQEKCVCFDFVYFLKADAYYNSKEEPHILHAPYFGNVKNLEPFAMVYLCKQGKPHHAAIYVGDGLFLWKMGYRPLYTITSFELMANVYSAEDIHLINF
jgi:hypothetical protein